MNINTSRYGNRNRRQRWLSPERVHQKFEELRAKLMGSASGGVLVQGEFSFSGDRGVGHRR